MNFEFIKGLNGDELDELFHSTIAEMNQRKAIEQKIDVGFFNSEGNYEEDIQTISTDELNENLQDGEVPIREVQFDEKGFELSYWQREAEVNKNWREFYENKVKKIESIITTLLVGDLSLTSVYKLINLINKVIKYKTEEKEWN